jgi:NAD(P)-dependent dehydrogenase (short-subunit alcohol dehydrogenase family)
LDERVAIVTGAGSGIGAETAKLFASRGMTVALVGRRAELLEAVAAEIAEGPGAAISVPGDLADADAPRRIVAAVLAETGRLDVIVNNAAFFRLTPVADVTAEELDMHFAVNVRAAYLLVTEALPALESSPAAAVVNVSSAAAVMYRPRQTEYGLTKAALEHMTMNMAAELAPLGIRVNAVRPGPTDTPIHRQAVEDVEARLAALAKMIPLGRVGRAEELAWWIMQLCDEHAEWVTGVVLSVDGGRVLGPPESI